METYRLVFTEVIAHSFDIEADSVEKAESIARQTETADRTKQISYDLACWNEVD